MPLHIKAKSGSVADGVILSGNLEIVKQLSELINGELVNDNRGFLVYTGTHMGKPVSAAYHGIGGSSQSIVLEELFQLGMKRAIELSYAVSKFNDACSVVISNSASYFNGGVIGEYIVPQNFVLSAVPSFDLIMKLDDALTKHKVNHIIGPTLTVDSLNGENGSNAGFKFLCEELDCAVLYVLSQIKGFESACTVLQKPSKNTPKRIITDIENSLLDAIIAD